MKRGLMRKILEYLATSASNCRNIQQIETRLSVHSKKLIKALIELGANGEVIKNKTPSGDTYCLRPSILDQPPMNLVWKAYKTLSNTPEAPTTSELATQIGEDSRKVSQMCRRHVQWEWMNKGTPKQKRYFYSPITQERIHSGNYERNMQLFRKLKEIVSNFSLGDFMMEQQLQNAFNIMLAQEDLVKFKKSISDFKEELFEIVRKAKKKSEIYAFLGIKPFYQDVSTWESSV